MKRFVILSLIIAMVAGAAFAQVGEGLSLSVWGRTAFVPLEIQVWKDGDSDRNKDNDLTTTLGQSWGGSFGRHARLQFHGDSEYVGFKIWLQTDNGSIGFGDFAGMWVKPFDWLKFDLGLFVEDALRGKIGDTDFHRFTMDMCDEDRIFTRFGNPGGPGALMSITPVEGLLIGFGLPSITGGVAAPWNEGWGATGQFGQGNRAKEVWEKIQIGAGYNIEGIGHIRAQYIGAGKYNFGSIDMTADDWAAGALGFGSFKRAEVAFALGMVEGMTLDIGVKIPFGAKDDDLKVSLFPGLMASAGFNMGFGDIGILARIDTSFGANSKYDGDKVYGGPFNMNFHLVPSYNLGFATIGLEAGIDMTGKYKEMDTKPGDLKAVDKSNAFDLGIGAWIKKPLGGNGSFKIGLGYTAIDLTSDADSRVMGYFRLPIVGELWF